MAILKYRDKDGNVVEIPALKGEKGDKGDPGVSGVYVGAGEAPADCNVQIDPTGEFTMPVMSVNGAKPDESGNVDIPTGGNSSVTYYETYTTGKTTEEVSVLELPITPEMCEKIINADCISITAKLLRPSSEATTETARGKVTMKIPNRYSPNANLLFNNVQVLPFPTDYAGNCQLLVCGNTLGEQPFKTSLNAYERKAILYKEATEFTQSPRVSEVKYNLFSILPNVSKIVVESTFPMGVGSFIEVLVSRGGINYEKV